MSIEREEFDALVERVASLERQASATVALVVEQVSTIVPRLQRTLDTLATRAELQDGLAGVATHAELQDGLSGVATHAELQDGLSGVRAELQDGLSGVATRAELQDGLSGVTIGLTEHMDERFGAIDHTLHGHTERFDTIDTKLDEIIGRLS